MNPSVPQSYIDAQTAEDPARAAAEYGANFRTDIEAFVSSEVVQMNTLPKIFERQPMLNTAYFAFADPAGGSGGDSFTLAIGHMDYARQTA